MRNLLLFRKEVHDHRPTFNAPSPQNRLSKSSLTSFILGILGCIPFLAGALAVLLGIIGFVRTGKPGVRGRWMAIVGGLLGLLSLGLWTFIIGGLAYFATSAPRIAAHDFIMNLTTGDLIAAKVQGPGFTDEKLEVLSDYCRKQGAFVDTFFSSTSITNQTARLEGTVKFSSGTQRVTVELEQDGSDWHVQSIEIKP